MYFKFTGGPQSHRHPFYGLGLVSPAVEHTKTYQKTDFYDFDQAAMDRLYLDSVQGYGGCRGCGVGAVTTEDVTSSLSRPVLSGLLTGLSAYFAARFVAIESKKAVYLAATMGVLDAVGILISGAIKTKTGSTV